MPIAPIFQRFVDDELALAPALVSKVVAGTVQLLAPANIGGGGERMDQADLMGSLRRGRALYERAFVESLRKQVADDLAQRADASSEEPKSPLDSLELMDESRVEVDIEISRAMQLIDTTAEWELRELHMFTSTLIGQTHVTADSNPFRPLVYATALWDAACVVASAQPQRAAILRTSAGVAAGLIKNACAAACSRLEAQGVEPCVYRTVVLASSGNFGRAAATPEPVRPSALSSLLAGMPQPPATPERNDGSPTGGRSGTVRNDSSHRRNPELEQALVRLDELMRHPPFEASRAGRSAPSQRLEQHRSALVASANEPIDRQVIELVTRLFESMLSDSALPAAFRPVLSRMQVAALRLCLAERSALDAFDHPVWRLLDRIGDQRRLFADRGSAPVGLPRLQHGGRRGDGGRGVARHRVVQARPQSHRRLPLGAAASAVALGASGGRGAASRGATRGASAAPHPAADRPDGQRAHDTRDPALRHGHLGAGDRR